MKRGIKCYQGSADDDPNNEIACRLAFILSTNPTGAIPLVQRLDGIYFNKIQDYEVLNTPIQQTYKLAHGVVFQSHFNKMLSQEYFGEHPNGIVIHNGTNAQEINEIPVGQFPEELNKFTEFWCCASNWRPHKRLNDNIRYFNEHAPETAALIVLGSNIEDHLDKLQPRDRIFSFGNVAWHDMISVFKACTHFLHLAWLDHCPNVVVDARAAGCQIVCSSEGGTKEIAGEGAIIIQEDEWDFEPCYLYQPPTMDFLKTRINDINNPIDIESSSNKYLKFLESIVPD